MTLDQLAQSSEAAALAKVGIAGGAAGSVLFGISSDVVGVIGGLCIGLAGLLYNVWATERRLKILRGLKAPEVSDV